MNDKYSFDTFDDVFPETDFTKPQASDSVSSDVTPNLEDLQFTEPMISVSDPHTFTPINTSTVPPVPHDTVAPSITQSQPVSPTPNTPNPPPSIQTGQWELNTDNSSKLPPDYQKWIPHNSTIPPKDSTEYTQQIEGEPLFQPQKYSNTALVKSIVALIGFSFPIWCIPFACSALYDVSKSKKLSKQSFRPTFSAAIIAQVCAIIALVLTAFPILISIVGIFL